MLERSLRQSLAMSHNDPSIFFTRPIAALLMAVALVSLLMPIVQSGMKRRKNEGEAAVA